MKFYCIQPSLHLPFFPARRHSAVLRPRRWCVLLTAYAHPVLLALRLAAFLSLSHTPGLRLWSRWAICHNNTHTRTHERRHLFRGFLFHLLHAAHFVAVKLSDLRLSRSPLMVIHVLFIACRAFALDKLHLIWLFLAVSLCMTNRYCHFFPPISCKPLPRWWGMCISLPLYFYHKANWTDVRCVVCVLNTWKL